VEIFEKIVEVGNSLVWGSPSALPWIIAVLLGAGLFVTLRLGFVQLRRLGHSIRCVLGRYDDPNDPGDVNHFQALATALSATVGIGNIAGVAFAIHYGGPGALFWMWLTAFFGMALKFSECTLAVHYRSFDDRGSVAGGPMYYIERGLGKSWKPLAVFFAFCAVIASFGGGNMNQANTVAQSAWADFRVPSWVIGLVLAVGVFAVIVGGIKSIARVTSRLVPVMAIVYVTGALLILLLHVTEVPGAFATIFTEAFNPKAGLGGAAAGTFMWTLLWGVRRGLFSNEAGQGSAPIAHAAAKTDEPVREGAVALLEPLIDTLVICTLTGLVIVTTGVFHDKHPERAPLTAVSVELVAEAPDAEPLEVPVTEGRQELLVFSFNDGPVDDALVLRGADPFTGTLRFDPEAGALSAPSGSDFRVEELAVRGEMYLKGSPLTASGFQRGLSPLGDWGNYIVTLCVFLFAFSTMISWSYYGDRCVVYLFGTRYVIVYRVIFCALIFVGAITAVEVVWDYGDLALGLMTVPNLIAVVLLSPKIVKLSRDYFARMKEQGRA
jgi:alanine or glycine:cation symporter, AGCS family